MSDILRGTQSSSFFFLFLCAGQEALHSDRKGFNTKKKKGADLRAKRNIEGTSVFVLLHVLVLFPLNYSLIMNRVSS